MSENIREFERCVVGGVLLDNSVMQDVARLLTPHDFQVEAYRKIFLVMLNLYETNRPIDSQLVVAELERRKELKSTTGVFSDLTSNIPRNVGYYCRLVKEASRRRQVNALLSKAQDEEGATSEVIAELFRNLSEFQNPPELPTGGEMFVNSDRFCSTVPEEVDWLVDRIIPRGANGIIAGVPKVSKSFLAADLALALALGEPFLGFDVPRPCKVALISREDHPGLTGWRIRAIRKARGFDQSPNLIVNTRQQTELLMLDDAGQVAQVIEQLKRHRVEFAILDVFNRLHSKDENDSQEMSLVLSHLTRIQSQARCGMALIHHYNKAKDGTWTERLRGSSAISGWVEWLMGVTLDDADTKTRKVEFELKAAEAPDAVYYRIESDKVEKTARIRVTDRVEAEAKEVRRERRLV